MAAVGTLPQIYQVTGIPVRTLQRWARAGELARVGTAYPRCYDARQALQLRRRQSWRTADGLDGATVRRPRRTVSRETDEAPTAVGASSSPDPGGPVLRTRGELT